MSQIRIPFGLDGKTSNSTSGPYAFWKNLKVKSSNLWKVAFIEIAGKSYGPLLKPSQEHIVVMKVDNDYKSHIYINGKSVLTDNYYIFGELVVSVVNTNVTMNDIVEFIEESFYDH
jgi:hypothetical protein